MFEGNAFLFCNYCLRFTQKMTMIHQMAAPISDFTFWQITLAVVVVV